MRTLLILLMSLAARAEFKECNDLMRGRWEQFLIRSGLPNDETPTRVSSAHWAAWNQQLHNEDMPLGPGGQKSLVVAGEQLPFTDTVPVVDNIYYKGVNFELGDGADSKVAELYRWFRGFGVRNFARLYQYDLVAVASDRAQPEWRKTLDGLYNFSDAWIHERAYDSLFIPKWAFRSDAKLAEYLELVRDEVKEDHLSRLLNFHPRTRFLAERAFNNFWTRVLQVERSGDWGHAFERRIIEMEKRASVLREVPVLVHELVHITCTRKVFAEQSLLNVGRTIHATVEKRHRYKLPYGYASLRFDEVEARFKEGRFAEFMPAKSEIQKRIRQEMAREGYHYARIFLEAEARLLTLAFEDLSRGQYKLELGQNRNHGAPDFARLTFRDVTLETYLPHADLEISNEAYLKMVFGERLLELERLLPRLESRSF